MMSTMCSKYVEIYKSNKYIERNLCVTLVIYQDWVNTLNAKLNPICHLLALLGAHPILHVSRIRIKVVLCVM